MTTLGESDLLLVLSSCAFGARVRYSNAVELWLDDETTRIDDPAVTGTKPDNVPGSAAAVQREKERERREERNAAAKSLKRGPSPSVAGGGGGGRVNLAYVDRPKRARPIYDEDGRTVGFEDMAADPEEAEEDDEGAEAARQAEASRLQASLVSGLSSVLKADTGGLLDLRPAVFAGAPSLGEVGEVGEVGEAREVPAVVPPSLSLLLARLRGGGYTCAAEMDADFEGLAVAAAEASRGRTADADADADPATQQAQLAELVRRARGVLSSHFEENTPAAFCAALRVGGAPVGRTLAAASTTGAGQQLKPPPQRMGLNRLARRSDETSDGEGEGEGEGERESGSGCGSDGGSSSSDESESESDAAPAKKGPKQCGTPGCTLPEFHMGLCTSAVQLTGGRRAARGAAAAIADVAAKEADGKGANGAAGNGRGGSPAPPASSKQRRGGGGGGDGGRMSAWERVRRSEVDSISSALERSRAQPAPEPRPACAGLGGGVGGGGGGGSSGGGGEAAGEDGALEPEEVRAHVEWASRHFHRFVPAAVPCSCLVDGRSRCALLGWARRGAPLNSEADGSDAPGSGYAVVGGYHCIRPVLLAAARVEVAVASISAGASNEWRAVRWADGIVSEERAARLGLVSHEGTAGGEGKAGLGREGGAAAQYARPLSQEGDTCQEPSESEPMCLDCDTAVWGRALKP